MVSRLKSTHTRSLVILQINLFYLELNLTFSLDYNLVSYITYVVIHKWQDLQFKVDSKRQKKLYALSFCQQSAERQPSRKYSLVFRFVVDGLTWGLKYGFKTNKPTHYLLDYGKMKTIFYTILLPVKYKNYRVRLI